MKKQKTRAKVFMALAAVLAAAVFVAAVLWFKQYYDNRYVLEDYYYTVVPLDYDFTPARVYNTSGEYMGLRSTYKLRCFSADGQERELEFTASLDMHDLYPPGTFVKVAASKQWATGKNAVAESDVPAAALEKIRAVYPASVAATLAEYAAERMRQLGLHNTPSLEIACEAAGNELIYTYTYSAGAKELAAEAAELLDPVYKSQFRADKEAFPELAAIFLEIKLDDGTVVFTRKYNEIVRFGYEQ
ncbi:MAG: DUF1093 domain-containing protein [Lachnospiraceae bacterium]|jgi:uncharacterized protein YxeA|nr:DUF1093 domain-containing protein [Lachnospiraceae bacterium]